MYSPTVTIIQGTIGEPRPPQETQGLTEKVMLELPLKGAVGICQARVILDKDIDA